MMQATFKPVSGLRNRHVQSVLASAKLRPLLAGGSERTLLRESKTWLIDVVTKQSAEPVCLHGELSYSPKALPEGAQRDLVVLIHGWEGCHDSIYLRSTAVSLLQAGYDVLRLNLRDHGPTHHLNRELFHASRLDELLAVLSEIRGQCKHRRILLAGFSLGGNFSVRVGANLDSGIVDQIVAVCPVFDPAATYASLMEGPAIYSKYFLRKWKRSLKQKSLFFPDLLDIRAVERFEDISEITQHLVSGHTGFTSVDEYFQSYRLSSNILESIQIPTHILLAQDDPVIPYDSSLMQAVNPLVQFETQRYGGHCGFIKDYRMNSYIAEVLLREF